jgi:NAD/NADP transhydrogenase alpha subunit
MFVIFWAKASIGSTPLNTPVPAMDVMAKVAIAATIAIAMNTSLGFIVLDRAAYYIRIS